MTHDYNRNSVTTLFAALNMLDSKVLLMPDRLHRHQEWLKFLKIIDCKTPKTKELHLVVDNYETHKHPKARLDWPSTRAFISISHPPALPGST